MARKFLSSIAWLLLLVGICLIVFKTYKWGLVCCFFGAFMRLIYNSEKYKYFNYLHLELLREFGPTLLQKKAKSACLFGFYRGLIDFIIVLVVPFIVVPQFNLPWWAVLLMSIVFILLLKPIFMKLDAVDKKQIAHTIDSYRRDMTSSYFNNRQL